MPGFLFDTSVWMALFLEGHPGHRAALEVFDGCSPAEPANFCRATEQSFLRLLTTERIQAAYGITGFSNAQAADQVQALQAATAVGCIDREPKGTRTLWLELAGRQTPSAKVWMDAYLAAFAIQGKMPFVTLDRDFQAYERRGLTLKLIQI